MTAPALPPSGSTAWYAHYTWLDEQHRRLRDEVATGNPTGTAPPTGLDLFTRTKGGRELLATRSATETTPYQPSIVSQKVAFIIAAPGAAGTSAVGWQAVALGTAAATAAVSTNVYTRTSRGRYNSTATAQSGAGLRSSTVQTFRDFGFHVVCRWGIGVSVATNRVFVGLTGTTAAMAVNVEPSTLLNQIGFGCDSTQTTMQLWHNDGAGVSVTTALGADFPLNTNSLDLYETCLYAEPNGTTVQWSVERIVEAGARPTTTKYASGTISSTDIPAANTGLAVQTLHGNAGTAAAVSLDIQSLYLETDL